MRKNRDLWEIKITNTTTNTWKLLDDESCYEYSKEYNNMLLDYIASEKELNHKETEMLALGWTRVVLPSRFISSILIGEWCIENLKCRYKQIRGVWYFESDRDASMFMLRWS